jgi:hypothetical protein
MYWYNDPEEWVSVAQLNSELRNAQLELVSAHCATHQLRLRYSADDLARFGRREVLRKSAEAANALHEFYQGIEKRVPATAAGREVPQASAAQVSQAVEWLGGYLREQRKRYFPQAAPLAAPVRAAMAPYFPVPLLDDIRVVELEGARIETPKFYEQARALGYDNLPDIPHMESMTFVDVVAFNEKLSPRALFHALVHAVQIQVLGLERYAGLWIRSFLKSKAHFTVALEVHAFSLASKFMRPEAEKFSVEEQVRTWAAEDRY